MTEPKRAELQYFMPVRKITREEFMEMYQPKRAEPAMNEHVRMLQSAARLLAEHELSAMAVTCTNAAAEIERLAARVRELEERPRYDVAALRGKIVSSVKDNPIEAQRVHDTLATIHGFAALERPWLPIESAPRDGTRLELWAGERPTYGRWAVFGYYPAAWRSDSGVEIIATHWRLPPSGPESKPDQETKGER